LSLRLQQAASVRPEAGYRTAELSEVLVRSINQLTKIFGIALNQISSQPQPIASLSITVANGIVNAQITDNFPLNLANNAHTINYFVECATDAGFATIVHTEFLGPVRGKNFFLGAQTLYFRAYSQTIGSPPSTPVTFGTPPTAVTVGGVAPPTQQSYKGSGTVLIGGKGFGLGVGNRIVPRL
jgi:hypothetical protein